MKTKLTFFSLLLIFLAFFSNTQAQVLPPQFLSYEQKSVNSIDLHWDYPSSHLIYPLNPIIDWNPYQMLEGTSARGCVSDGKYIYMIGSPHFLDNANFGKYDMDGNFIEIINIPGLPSLGKATYDGEKYIYAIADGSLGKPGIYQIDIEKKELIRIIPTQMNLLHITYIPELDEGRGGFEAGNPNYGYYLNLNGEFIKNGPYYDPDIYTACVSTAYYDGKIYALCQTTGSLKIIAEFDLETAQPTGKILDVQHFDGSYGIIASQMGLDFSIFEYSSGKMNGILSTYWSQSDPAETGYRSVFFELGERPELENLQGYNVYRNNVKLNSTLIPKMTFTYEDTELKQGIDYTYTTTAQYNGTESGKSEPLTINLPLTNGLPFFEDFSSENLDDNGWTVFTNNQTSTWKIDNSTEVLGENLPSLSYTWRFIGDYNQTLTSKPLEISSDDITLMRFQTYCTAARNTALHVELLLGNNWNTIHTINSWAATDWVTTELDITSLLTGYEGENFQIRFSFTGANSGSLHSWYFDNIRIWNPGYVEFGGTARQISSLLENSTISLVKVNDPFIQYNIITNGNGEFYQSDVEKGIYKLTIIHNSEIIYEDNAYEISESDTQVDLSVLGALIDIDNTALNITMGENKFRTISFPIKNAGNAILNYNAELIFDQQGSGNEIGDNDISQKPSWEMTGTFELNDTKEKSLILHQNYFYTYLDYLKNESSYSFRISKYDLSGNFIETLTINTSEDIYTYGIISDGERMYQRCVAPKVLIPIDLENRTTVMNEAIAIKSNLDNIRPKFAAYDAKNGHFYLSDDHEMKVIDKEGNVLSGSIFNPGASTYVSGLTVDNFAKEGPFLWIFSWLESPSGITFEKGSSIFQYSLKEKKMLSSFKAVDEITGEGYPTKSESLIGSTTLIPGYYTLTGLLYHDNKATVFTYKMYPYETWLLISQNSQGTLTENETVNLNVNLSTDKLQEGDSRSGSIIITSNSAERNTIIPIRLEVDNSMEERCYPPINLTAVSLSDYTVKLSWEISAEASDIRGYNVFRDGVLYNTELITDKEFIDKLPKMGEQQYTVQTVYNFGCESSESNIANTSVNNPDLLLPVNNAEATVAMKNNVLINWDAPQYAYEIYDDFESYEPFIINNIGNWKLYDGDKAWTYYDANITYPNRGERMAFIVFNPSETYPNSSVTTPDESKQLLACYGANVDGLANNDWLISRELNFDRPFTFSFMARTFSSSYPKEKINVGYSLTGNDPEDFIFINGTDAIELPVSWLEYSYQIPAEAKYVVINCVTMNGWICLFDNIFIGHKENFSDLLGYNIYRDNQKLNQNLLSTPRFVENNLENGDYTYEIEALFANGITTRTTSNTVTVNYSNKATPPRDLEGTVETNKISLTWNAPLWSDEMKLRYDDGTPYDAGGNNEGEQLIAIRFSSEDIDVYDGYTITGVEFYIADEVKYVVGFVFTDGIPSDITQQIEVTPNQYITLNFDLPVVIEAGKEYMVGYSYETNGAGYYPASHDANPGIPGKSDLYSNDGFNWYSMARIGGSDWNINWNIAALVELKGTVKKNAKVPVESRWKTAKNKPANPMRKQKELPLHTTGSTTRQLNVEGDYLMGYKVYRDNAAITSELMTKLNYTDETVDLTKNDIPYYVTAVYAESGEKQSETIILNKKTGLDNNLTDIHFYPNPAKDKLFVEGDYDLIKLSTIEGKLIYTTNGRNMQTTINTHALSRGIYILTLQQGAEITNHKIILE